MRKLYLLEDDLTLSNLMDEFLTASGFVVKTFSDYRLFFDAIRANKPDIILLDLMLPMIDGVEVLKYVKSNLTLHNIPIIVTSGKTSESEKVLCLDLGADDYLGKPFGFNELVSRINAVLRRFGSKNELNYNNLVIDVNLRCAYIDGNLINLTKKEFDLLLYLVERIDKVVTKDELIKHFWENISSNSRSIDMHIKALRDKVFIKVGLKLSTILKVGYKLEKN